MIPVLRRLIIISILFGIILFIQSIQVETISGINPKTLAVLGFLILASFTTGEILSYLKLPRVIGYLLIGLIFGPYSTEMLRIPFLKVLSLDVIKDLSLINTVTLSVIALTAGLELKLTEIKKSLKSIFLILSFKTLLMFILIPATIFALAPFIPFLANAGWKASLAAGLLVSVIAMGTSIELTLVVANEAKAKGKYIDLILSSAIVKDVIVILLLAISLTISTSLLNPSSQFDIYLFSALGIELLLSIIVGGIFGVLLIAYYKFVGKEILLFLLAFIVLASQLSIIMHLETLIVFVAAGFVVQNFSTFGEKFHHPLLKLSLPIFITFFTVAGAAIDITSLQSVVLVGFALVVVRSIVLYFSVKTAAIIAKEVASVKDYGWVGFLSIGGLMLGVSIIIEQKLPGFGAQLKPLITSIVAINIFLGPILLKLVLNKIALTKPADIEPQLQEVAKIIATKEDKTYSTKFKEPSLSDPKLNKSLFAILLKLNDILKVFNSKFIYSRTEESIELVLTVSEKYTDNLIVINSILKEEKFDSQKLINKITDLKSELSEYYLFLCNERKTSENNILKLDPLVKDLFNSLVDLTDGLTRTLNIDLEDNFIYQSPNDKFRDKFYKNASRIKLVILSFFQKNYKLKRVVEYKNLAKYFLVGKSSSEILETVNLVGAERLTTLKKIHTLFTSYFEYLDELIAFLSQNENKADSKEIFSEKLKILHQTFTSEISIYRTEIHNTTNEIISRLTYALATPFNGLLEALEIAGTYKFNSQKYKYSTLFKESEAKKDLTSDAIRHWINFYHGYLGIIEKESYLYKLKFDLTKIVNASLINISKEINGNLREVCSKLTIEIADFRKLLNSIEKNDDLQSQVNISKNKFFVSTIRFYTQHLENIKRSKKLNLLLEKLMKDFSEVSAHIPEEILLLEDSDFKFEERIPQFVKLKSIHLRNITKSILEQKFLREMGEVNELLLNHLNLTIIELKNLYSIVSYHFKSAENELKENNGKSSQLALELHVTLNDKLEFRIDQLSNQIDQLESNINTKILEKVELTISELSKHISENSLLKTSIYIKKHNYIGEVINRYNNMFLRLKKLLRKYQIVSQRNYRKYLQPSINRFLNKFTFFNPIESVLMSETILINEERIKKLPFLYRKLFDGTTIESDDFFVQSNQLETKILTSIKNFNEGKFSSTVLIGEPGSGKNTLINSIINRYLSNYTLVRHEFKKTCSSSVEFVSVIAELLGFSNNLKIEELILSMNDRNNKRVIILENIGRLFFKRINGFEAIKTFSYIVSSTSKNIFWVCSIGKHPWTFINNSFELDRIFFSKIDISVLHRNDIRNIILNRHSVTGYSLFFKTDEFGELKNKLLKGSTVEDEQKKLSNHFFSKLEEFAEGNIISGMYYWLQSIREVKGNTLIIEPLRKIQFAILDKLEDIYLLTLSEILVHETFTDVEHSQLFDVNVEVSREILGYLAALNILYIDQIEFMSNRYFLNKSIYKLVEKELIKRNMI